MISAAPSQSLPSAFVVAVVAVILLLALPQARAEAGSPRVAVQLEYTRGPGAERCANEESLRAETAGLLGFDPFQAEAHFKVIVRLQRQGPELVASMELRNRNGLTFWTDEFGTSSGCKTLISAVVLGIVIRIQNNPALLPAKDKEKEPAPEPPTPPPPKPALEPPTPAPQKPPRHDPPPAPAPVGGRAAPAPPERWQMEAELGAAVAFGVAPGVSAGPTLSIQRRWSELVSVGVEGRALASLSQEVKGIPVGTSVFIVSALFCLHHRFLFGCGLAEFGAYRFAPQAPYTIRQSTHPLLALAARFGVEWPLSRRLVAHGALDVVGAMVDADLSGDPHRGPTFSQALWNSPPIGVAVGFGLAMTF